MLVNCCDICSAIPAQIYSIPHGNKTDISIGGRTEYIYENKDLCSDHACKLLHIIIALYTVNDGVNLLESAAYKALFRKPQK